MSGEILVYIILSMVGLSFALCCAYQYMKWINEGDGLV